MSIEESEERCRALLHVRGLVRGCQQPDKEKEACAHTSLSRSLSLSFLSLSLSRGGSRRPQRKWRWVLQTPPEEVKFTDNQEVTEGR